MSEKLFFDYLERKYKISARLVLVSILFFHTIFFLIEMGDEKVAILFDWMPYFYEIYDSLYYPYMDAIAYPIMDLLYSYGLYEFFSISENTEYITNMLYDYYVSIYPIILLFIFCSWTCSWSYETKS